jgi:hypothetical protein
MKIMLFINYYYYYLFLLYSLSYGLLQINSSFYITFGYNLGCFVKFVPFQAFFVNNCHFLGPIGDPKMNFWNFILCIFTHLVCSEILFLITNGLFVQIVQAFFVFYQKINNHQHCFFLMKSIPMQY